MSYDFADTPHDGRVIAELTSEAATLKAGIGAIAFALGWTDLKGMSVEQYAAALKARNEALEAALQEIYGLYVNAPGWAAPAPSHQREYKMFQIARAALESKP